MTRVGDMRRCRRCSSGRRRVCLSPCRWSRSFACRWLCCYLSRSCCPSSSLRSPSLPASLSRSSPPPSLLATPPCSLPARGFAPRGRCDTSRTRPGHALGTSTRRFARAARALFPARARAVAWRRLVPECLLLRPRRGGHRSALRGRRRRGAHLFSAGSRGARPPQVWRRVLHLHGAHRAGTEGARAAHVRPLLPRGVHTALAAHVGHAALPKLQRGGRPRRLRGGPCRGRRAAGGAPPSTSPAGAAI
mmetsp:Transcript_48099/g.151118  ORF Transcript_48099/g.151118 Transcript_48099/m.151118 type:complete len:248 (-) Transcript_48099:326-1069(-)